MAKRHKPEEIITKLRQVDVLVPQGSSVADAIRSIGVTEVTDYRWRQEYSGLKSDQVKRMKELETENSRLRKAIADLTLDKLIEAGDVPGKLLSPARRRVCIDHVRDVLNISERRACRALGQHRSTQRKVPRGRDDEEDLTADLVELARQYGRYGYRKISALLRDAGWMERSIAATTGKFPVVRPDLAHALRPRHRYRYLDGRRSAGQGS